MEKAKIQLSLLSFAVKTTPHSFMHRPSPPTKRTAAVEKRRPGRPRKKPRQDDDWKQQWSDAVENESSSLLRAWESYEAIIVNYYDDKPSGEIVSPKKFQTTCTAERKFEVREFAFSNSEYLYQQVAGAFKMPKTTVLDIIKQSPRRLPARGRGNKKDAGRRLSYQGDRGSAGPVGAGNEGFILTSFSSAGEGEGTAADSASNFFI